MATTPVVVIAPPAQTLTLELYPVGSDTIANGVSGDTLTESTNRKGRYSASVTEAITGDHYAIVKSGSTTILSGWVLSLADTTDEQYVADTDPGLVEMVATATKNAMDSSSVLLQEIKADVTAVGDGISEAVVRDAISSAFTSYLVMPFTPVTGDFFFVLGDDHKEDNPRGALGPLGPVTSTVDLVTDATITLRAGFTQKVGINYTGVKFNGTAYAVATATADTYDIYVEIDGDETVDVPAGVYGFDVEMVYPVPDSDPAREDIITLLSSEATGSPSHGEYASA